MCGMYVDLETNVIRVIQKEFLQGKQCITRYKYIFGCLRLSLSLSLEEVWHIHQSVICICYGYI